MEQIQNGDCDKKWEEYEISVPWGKIAGKWWGPKNKQPILALHGWQDNAGTFDKLCPLLDPNLAILCIDLPGHGLSTHYPVGMQYYLFLDGISLIRRIVRQYNWKNIILMGHSLGGALCFMYAACFPDEVSKFISFDIAGPTVRDHKRIAEQTGRCIDKMLDYETLPETKLPCYKYDEMIDVVLSAYDGSVDRDSVKVLMKRGMAPAPKHLHKEGYHFVRDLRLKVSILGMLSKEQVLAYAEKIKCKVLNIRAQPGMKFENPYIYDMVIDKMRQNAELVIYKTVCGTHHVHLNEPKKIAKDVNEFLLMK